MGSLFVTFMGDEVEVEHGSSLTFGRDAQLVLDAQNRHLHRVVGVFVALESVWVLQNCGRHLPLSVRDRDSTSRAEVAPGAQLPILFEEFTVSLCAGRANYELFGALASPPPLTLELSPATDTIDVDSARLNDDQRLLLAALAEPSLRGDPLWPASMPSNKAVARRLGWSTAKYNRKLDYLCSRLADRGVPGMRGDHGTHASSRRLRLVEHLVERGAIGVRDLDRLPDQEPEPEPARDR